MGQIAFSTDLRSTLLLFSLISRGKLINRFKVESGYVFLFFPVVRLHYGFSLQLSVECIVVVVLLHRLLACAIQFQSSYEVFQRLRFLWGHISHHLLFSSSKSMVITWKIFGFLCKVSDHNFSLLFE